MKLTKLEAARGFTALFVFLAHLPVTKPFGPLNHIWLLTQEMVIVFFVLSGFVIFYSCRDTMQRGFMPYFWRRFIRIYAVFIPLLILLCFLQPQRLVQDDFIPTLVGNLFMLQDTEWCKPGVIVPTVFRNLPLWSLHYEWWFYMAFFPVAFFLPADRQKHFVGCLGVASAIVYFFAPHFIPRLAMYLTVWWLGVEAARLYLQSPAALTLKALRAPLCYVLLTAIPGAVASTLFLWSNREVSPGTHPFLETRHLLAGVAIVVGAFAWRALRWIGFRWLLAPFAILAPISYSLYIAHYPLVVHAKYFDALQPRWLQISAYTVATLSFCVVTELLFYPWLRDKLLRSKSIPSASLASST